MSAFLTASVPPILARLADRAVLLVFGSAGEEPSPPPAQPGHGPYYRSHRVTAISSLVGPDLFYSGPDRRKRERRSRERRARGQAARDRVPELRLSPDAERRRHRDRRRRERRHHHLEPS